MKATPITPSIARVEAKASKRLGYRYVAVCEHCRGLLTVPNDKVPDPLPLLANDLPFIHARTTLTEECHDP